MRSKIHVVFWAFLVVVMGVFMINSFHKASEAERYGLKYEIENGNIILNWNKVKDENDYYLTIQQDGIQLEAVWVSGTSYSVLDTFEGGVITFNVAVSGESGAAVDYVKMSNIQPYPLNPFGSVYGSDVVFCWDIVYPADLYELEIATRDDKIIEQISISSGKTSVKISGLSPGPYKWSVTPKTTEGSKGMTSEWAYFEITEAEPIVESIFGVEKEGVLPMLSTPLAYPETAVVGPDGAIYVSDTHANVIRRCKDGISEIYVGTLTAGNSVGGVEARDTFEINMPTDIVFDDEGNMFFNDYGNRRICKVEKDTGLVYSVWDHGEIVKKFYLEEDNSLTILCAFDPYPSNFGKIINSISGEVYYEGCILKNPAGLITNGNRTIILDTHLSKLFLFVDNKLQKSISVIGYSSALWQDNNNDIYLGEHTAMSKLNWELEKEYLEGDYANITYITQGEEDSLLVTDSDAGRVYSVDKCSGEQTLLIASKSVGAAITDIEERGGYLFFLDNQSGIVWRYDPSNGETERFIGNGRKELAVIGADRLETGLFYPTGLATDGNGNFYISEQHHILKINKEGKVELFAGAKGRGEYGYRDGPAQDALFQSIKGLSFDDESHTLYVADTYNNMIREIKDGIVSTIAGDGLQGKITFGVPGTESHLNRPHDVIVENGQIYFSDSWNSTVVRLDERGILCPVAGRPICKSYQGEGDYSGDGKDAVKAELNTPLNLYYFEDVLYILDAFNNRVRVVKDGKINTIIGCDRKGYDSNDPMVLNMPSAIFVNDQYIYVADTNYLVRRYKREYLEEVNGESSYGTDAYK